MDERPPLTASSCQNSELVSMKELRAIHAGYGHPPRSPTPGPVWRNLPPQVGPRGGPFGLDPFFTSTFPPYDTDPAPRSPSLQPLSLPGGGGAMGATTFMSTCGCAMPSSPTAATSARSP